MIGSSADGEALNAARLAHRLLQDRGMTWDQVIGGNGVQTANPFAGFQWHYTPPRPPPRGGERWRTVADFIRTYRSESINDWERHFLGNILTRHALTEKQWAILEKIGAKCGIIVD